MIEKRSYRQTSQDACRWNVRFATALPDESPYDDEPLVREHAAWALTRLERR